MYKNKNYDINMKNTKHQLRNYIFISQYFSKFIFTRKKTVNEI